MEPPGHHRSMSRISELSAALEGVEERPVRCAKFRRQELWAYKPVWSPLVVSTMYALASLILIPLGAVIFVQSTKLMSTSLLRYDNFDRCSAETLNQLSPTVPNSTAPCILAINIPRRTRGRVFLYYGLVNFYQNARQYTRSRSFPQLSGARTTSADLKTCTPDIYNTTDSSSGTRTPFVPCGLTARSFFNDTFTLYHDIELKKPVEMSNKNIAWAIDREQLYKNSSTNTAEQNALITSEEFMVWMRLAPYRAWHKLHRRIQEPLENRTYFMLVNSQYPVASFNGRKYVYLMESTWFGGPNHFLGLANIAIGGLSLVLSMLYGIRSKFAPEPQIPPETEVPWIDFAQDGSGDGHGNSPSRR